MTIRQFFHLPLLMLLTFTGLGAATSTAFSQNAEKLLVGEVRNFVIANSHQEMKDFAFMDGDGKERKLSDFKDKTILLNFWATWCAPCLKEMPGIDRLQGKLGSGDFTVLAISQDLQGMEKVKKFLKALKIEHLAAYNDKTTKSGRSAGVFGLPATIILKKDLVVFGRLVGPAEWDSDEAVALIKHAMRDGDS